MATSSLLRPLEELLASSFNPAQLHKILYGLFGQRFVGGLPPHQFVGQDDYFFETVQHLARYGVLLNNKMGQDFFSELVRERPGRGEEISALAGQFDITIDVPIDSAPLQLSPRIIEVPTSSTVQGAEPPLSPLHTHHRLTLNIANGLATMSWWTGDRELKDSAHLPRDTSMLHAAQDRLRRATRHGDRPTQIGDASMALGTALSQHLFRGAMQSQFFAALSEMNSVGGALELQLEFGGEERLAQLSWELLRAPYPPHNFLCTLPGLIVTRRYPLTITPFKLPDTPKKLLIVLSAEPGRSEAMTVKKLWEDNSLDVQILEGADSYELADALLEGPWDVVHFITHGEAERVILQDSIHSSQLANMVQGNVRTAAVLSVCCSAESGVSSEQDPADDYERGSVAWRGVAQALVGAGVPNVIAWSNLAYVDDCARITPRWHTHYLKSGDPRKAMQKARQAIFAAKEYSFGWLAHFTG